MINNEQAQKLSDGEIVRLSLENRDYFLLVVNRYKEKLSRYVRRLSNLSLDDAEDLLQEIFLKVYLNLNDFDEDLKFSSWIYAIARNQTISHYRKLKIRAEGHAIAINDKNFKEIMFDFDIKKNLDMNYLKEDILKILDKLDGKYREVLILKFFEEKDYREISDIIKRPIGTVGSLMNKAKIEFKKKLIEQNIKL
ncbi:RNA polymerase sigma factor [Candidatus Falkowbacteria bacterium]|nr:RNA polymerase sigma factor [Candidatus Falkowbacteria bacterium]